MSLDLKKLKRLLKAASPEEWKVEKDQVGISIVQAYEVVNGFRMRNVGFQTVIASDLSNKQDAALIVAAVNSLPGLLEEIERLTKALVQATESMKIYPASPVIFVEMASGDKQYSIEGAAPELAAYLRSRQAGEGQ